MACFLPDTGIGAFAVVTKFTAYTIDVGGTYDAFSFVSEVAFILIIGLLPKTYGLWRDISA